MDQHIFDHAPQHVYDALARTLLNFTIVFVSGWKEASVCLGSGTLVNFGGIYGIVTCGHVAKAVLARETVSVSTHDANSSNKLLNSIQIHNDDTVILGADFEKTDGPDLAFIKLDETSVSTLKAKLVFIDADATRDRARRGQQSFPYQADYIIGSVEELNKKEGAVLEIAQQINAGEITQTKSNDTEYDYFSFVSFDAEPLNESHEGTSGGGWWRLSFQKTEQEKFEIVERNFLGVAFRQSGGNPNAIRGHGPKSIFENLRKAINIKFPKNRF
jgi:hypothetical protein